MANEQEKELAARASLQFVYDGRGDGHGLDSDHAIRFLAERVRTGLKFAVL